MPENQPTSSTPPIYSNLAHFGLLLNTSRLAGAELENHWGIILDLLRCGETIEVHHPNVWVVPSHSHIGVRG